MSLEIDYSKDALLAASDWLHLLPSMVQRKVKLALSVIESHGEATGEELADELGSNWVIARRTKDIVQRYGPDVKCYTPKQYAAARIRAIEKRIESSHP